MKLNQNIRERIISPILMWIIVFIGVLIIIKYAPNMILFKRNIYTIILFIVTVFYWVYFFIGSVIVHKKAPLSAAKIENIVKIGTYNIVRHPIYSSDIILSFGIFFFIPNLKVLVSIIWLSIILLIWIILEEKTLIKKFPKEYLEYKKQVPMFFPKILKRK